MKKKQKNTGERKSKTDWARIDAMKDDDIDYSDIPELDEKFWKNAKWVKYDIESVNGRPMKKPITLRLDLKIINWFKEKTKNKGYQTIIGKELYCFHYKPSENWNSKKGLSHAIDEVRCGLVYSHAYKFALFYPFFMFFWFLQFTLQITKNIL